jgi:adenosine deaminase
MPAPRLGSRAASSSPPCATSAPSARRGSPGPPPRSRIRTSRASGEWAGPESVRGALALPVPVTRLGHGVRAIEDPELVRELADRGTVLEVCPTSNVVLGAYPDYQAHPFPVLRDAGVRVTLGSDDPPYWEATVGGEYAVARREWGLDDDALRALTRTAIEAAFVPDDLRASLLARP